MKYRYTQTHWRLRLGGLLLLLGCALSLSAQPLLEIDQRTPETISDHAWYSIPAESGPDASRRGEVPLNRAAEFVPATARNVNLGFSSAQLWAHFSLHYAADSDASMVLLVPRPLLDEIELFVVHPDGHITRTISGDHHPVTTRDYRYRGFAFELKASPGQQLDYYVRARSHSSALHVPLKLMRADAFAQLSQREDFFLGGFFGVMAGLTMASALFFLMTRQRIFALYFFYIIGFTATLLTISGYGMLLLWPQAVEFQQYISKVAIGLTMLAGAVFVGRFLALERRWPALNHAILAVAISGPLFAIYYVITGQQLGVISVIAGALLLCLLALVAFTHCVLKGDYLARYFLLGWFASVVGITAAALDMYGIIASSTLSSYGIYLGSFAEFAALSVALGARLQGFRRDKEAEIARAGAELSALNQNLESMVQHRTRELQQRNRELGELAIRDSLTGLYNHSTTIELLDQILNQSQRYDFPVTVLMIDLDHFKRINDDFGHQVGDAVLESMSQTLLDCVRESDIVGRYGGEEFLIVMPHADALAAREFGERLLAEVRHIDVPNSNGRQLSISVGIAVYSAHGPRVAPADLIQRADQALYRSKREGRDKLTIDSLSLVRQPPDNERPHDVPA